MSTNRSWRIKTSRKNKLTTINQVWPVKVLVVADRLCHIAPWSAVVDEVRGQFGKRCAPALPNAEPTRPDGGRRFVPDCRSPTQSPSRISNPGEWNANRNEREEASSTARPGCAFKGWSGRVPP